jgi:hypothetical protein
VDVVEDAVEREGGRSAGGQRDDKLLDREVQAPARVVCSAGG